MVHPSAAGSRRGRHRSSCLATVVCAAVLLSACGSASRHSASGGGAAGPSNGSHPTATDGSSTSAPVDPTSTTVLDRPEVVVIGDSLVFQSSQELNRRFDAAQLRISAVPGATLAEQRDAVHAAVAREPDVVVVLLGTNDVLQGTEDPAGRIRSAMNELQPVPCVRWLTIAPFYGQAAPVRILNEVIRRTAADHDNTGVVEWGNRVEQHPEWFEGLVHYGPEGERALAETIVDAVRSCQDDPATQ